MSSEAAKKAYREERFTSFAPYMRAAFDHGAVVALRQAAEKVEAAIRNSDRCGCGNVEVDWDDLDMAWIWPGEQSGAGGSRE